MLEAFGLTADRIASQITAINQKCFRGTITDGDIQYTVKGGKLGYQSPRY